MKIGFLYNPFVRRVSAYANGTSFQVENMFDGQLTPNGISQSYQLDQYISVFKVVGLYFSFLFKF